MSSFDEENEKKDIIDNHYRRIQKEGCKKYVITIKEKYIHLLDSMSIEDRNEIINDIISVHNDAINEKQQIKQIAKGSIIALLSIIVLIFFIPCLLWFINLSFSLTKNNYAEMQNNFEVLYSKKIK